MQANGVETAAQWPTTNDNGPRTLTLPAARIRWCT